MTSDYVPGGVAGILGGADKEKTTPDKKLKSKQKALLQLFGKPKPTPTVTESLSPKKKKKKNKKTNPEAVALAAAAAVATKETSPKKRKAEKLKTPQKPEPPAKKVKVDTPEKTTENETPKKKPTDRADQRTNRKKKKNPEKDIRTIFVGNLPNKVDKKKVTAFFKKYGVIESVRFRSGAPADLKLPKKAVLNTKAFHEGLTTMIGYVVFKKKEAAKDALNGNGGTLEGNHIQVDMAKNAKKVDTKKSVFIGNLPYDVEDEKLRLHFEDCGKIEGIRVVRDRQTGLGKGFAYIKFEDKDGVDMAIRLNNRLFLKRTLRVQRAEDQVTKKKGQKKNKATGNEAKQGKQLTDTDKKDKKKAFSRNMPSNIKPADFQGVKAKSIEKMKKRSKQKKKLKKKKQSDAGNQLVKKNKVPHKGAAARARIATRMKKSKKT